MRNRTIENALSREELDQLKPSTEEMFQNTWRSTRWYNEAVWTAAALFVEAAEESDEFREKFVNKEMVDKEVGDTGRTVEMQAWRYMIDDECPDVADRLWGIGLSAFQGGSAEQVARRYLEEEC